MNASKKAELTVEIDGFGELDCDYFKPTSGREPFAIARSTRSKFTGSWVRCVRLEAEFALALRNAIEARLTADHADATQ